MKQTILLFLGILFSTAFYCSKTKAQMICVPSQFSMDFTNVWAGFDLNDCDYRFEVSIWIYDGVNYSVMAPQGVNVPAGQTRTLTIVPPPGWCYVDGKYIITVYPDNGNACSFSIDFSQGTPPLPYPNFPCNCQGTGSGNYTLCDLVGDHFSANSVTFLGEP